MHCLVNLISKDAHLVFSLNRGSDIEFMKQALSRFHKFHQNDHKSFNINKID